jgi:hypothetical protein
MAGNRGGIGRFAARNKGVSQPDAPHAATARTDSTTTEDELANDNSAVAAAANAAGEEPAPANDTVVDGESSTTIGADEQPTTIFHSIGYDDHDGRPTTSGSNLFSSLGNIFENNDDATENVFFSSTPAEFMNESNLGQEYGDYVAGYQELEGIEQGSPMGGGRAESPLKDNYCESLKVAFVVFIKRQSSHDITYRVRRMSVQASMEKLPPKLRPLTLRPY